MNIGGCRIRKAIYQEVFDCCKYDKRLHISKTALNFALDVDGLPVAYVSCYHKAGSSVLHFTLAHTNKEYRNGGYGAFLFRQVENIMRKKNPNIDSAETCSLLENEIFHSRLGFTAKKYVDLALGPVVYMVKHYGK